ncbi:MAG: hypothetical protein E7665_01665 [Ruminococcaceae bacterium]|nr:hypothetical protein [Oscillospiraceae bacterium]
MKIGVSKKCISTDLPIHLCGFGNPARGFDGVYDDIFVKALAISEKKTVIIVTADVLGFDKSLLKNVTKRIYEKTGVPEDAVLFNASHTHSAPNVSPAFNPVLGAYEEEYGEFFYDSLYKVALSAYEDLEEGELSFSSEALSGLGMNRRRVEDGVCINAPNEEGIKNDTVTVIKGKCKNRTKAILFEYACHPSTIGFNYMLGDFPGVAAKLLEKEYPGTTALFMQGCCGNIRVSTKSPDAPRWRAGTYGDVENFGKILFETAKKALSKEMLSIKGDISYKVSDFELPLQKYLSREEYHALANSNISEYDKCAYQKYYDEYDSLKDKLEYSVQKITLGDKFVLFALEGEVCVEYDYNIKSMLPDKYVITVGYSNGSPGYICTEKMYELGKNSGYEPVRSCHVYFAGEGFEPYCERIILEKAKELAAENE